ncbi:hypothetical protein CXB51_033899 [Gossypium anomalum]|uniref:C2H2-type domain-containing protein n=1 Tax=Gossypium anomalum TaxID=47600 RepID=A0A8J6CIR8_9ROSI|nr:hypothetical protein CXB51_033899 [Gossypium anomalum]
MSNISGDDDDGSFSSGDKRQQLQINKFPVSGASNTNGSSSSSSQQPLQGAKRKRNLPGTPDPNAEVIALSPTTLMATNRFVCEICKKGFQRDQNLQLHRRGHNLPWKLKQRATTEVKKRVYVCPEPSCVHHNAARALGDLTGIKKHFSRKHGEKKWKCDKCSKKYAVQSDWKAHQKTCGTKEYKCDCGTIFARRDSFITHRAFCDALAEENNKVNNNHGGLMNNMGSPNSQNQIAELMSSSMSTSNGNELPDFKSLPQELVPMQFKSMNMGGGGGIFASSSGTLFGGPRTISSSSSSLQLSTNTSSGFSYLQDNTNGCCQVSGSPHMSATALLQKAAQMGSAGSNSINSTMMQKSFETPYDQFPVSQADQSNMVGISHGSPNEMTQLFNAATGAMNDMGMFTTTTNMFINQGGLMMNNHMEHEDSASPTVPSIFGVSNGGSNMTTLDFMGINNEGSRTTAANLHEEQFEQQRMPMMNPFQQQQLSHGDSAIEKPIWDV